VVVVHGKQEPPEWKKRGQQWRSRLGFGNWQKNQENRM
jgi:hypothetical protein